MKNLTKKTGATLALAASALSVGAALAPSASAMGESDEYRMHNAATYSSSASCNTNRSGAINTISHNRYFRGFTYRGTCVYNSSTGKWTYGHLTYITAGGPAIAGDHWLAHWVN